MAERLSPHNPQNQETRGHRRRRHFMHYYGAPLIMALGLFMAGSFGIPEGQRIIQGDFGKITDTHEMEDLRSGDYKAATNPENKPPLANQTGGWLLDFYLGSGFASASVMLGYGVYLRRNTRDRR